VTATLSATTVAANESQRVDPKGAERRRAPRFPHRSTARLFMLPAGRLSKPIDVTVVDYSEGGIGLVSVDNLLVGQMYVVREPFLTKHSSSLYTVVRSDARGDGTYSVGLLLSNTLEDKYELPEADWAEPAILTRRKKLLLATLLFMCVMKVLQIMG
jgi:hypothetical protein